MVLTYPSSIDTNATLPPFIDGQPIVASQIEKLRKAIIAVEAELGVRPAGIYTTVRARLDAMETAIANLQIISLAGDLGGTLLEPKVIGIQGRPVSDGDPGFGQALVWNGIAWTPTDVSGGGGGGPAHVLVYRPGEAPSGSNVYETWDALMTARGVVQGPVTVIIDDSVVSPATIDTGPWDLKETGYPTKIQGYTTQISVNNPVTRMATLSILNNGQLVNASEFENIIVVGNNEADHCINFSSLMNVKANDAIFKNSSASFFLFNVDNSSYSDYHLFELYGNSSISAGSGPGVIGSAANGVFVIQMNDYSTLESSTISLTGGTTTLTVQVNNIGSSWTLNQPSTTATKEARVGFNNVMTSDNSLAIGSGNTINTINSSITGGTSNTISSEIGLNHIGGGGSNSISADKGTICGGQLNIVGAAGASSFIGGGESNNANGLTSVIGGGYSNIVNAISSIIAGGQQNTINTSATESVISGGQNNTIGDINGLTTVNGSTISGGLLNTIGPTSDASAASRYATISGGNQNSIDNMQWATIGGGLGNSMSGAIGIGGFYNTIAGGHQNQIINCTNASILGGQTNVIDGTGGNGNGTTVSGRGNQATGDASDAFLVGTNNHSIGRYSGLIGQNNNNSSMGGMIFGRSSTIATSSENAIALGAQANAIRPGQLAFSSGFPQYGPGFNPGDGQFSIMMLYGISVNGAAVDLKDYGNTIEFATENSKAYKMRITLLANRADAAGRACFEHTLLVHTSGGTAVIDDDTVVQNVPNGTAWSFAITTSGNIVRLTFTGTAGQTVNALGTIQWSELIGF